MRSAQWTPISQCNMCHALAGCNNNNNNNKNNNDKNNNKDDNNNRDNIAPPVPGTCSSLTGTLFPSEQDATQLLATTTTTTTTTRMSTLYLQFPELALHPLDPRFPV